MTFSSYASLFSSLVIFSAADEEDVALAVAVAAALVECTAAFVATARRTVTKWVAVGVEVDEDIVDVGCLPELMLRMWCVLKGKDCYQSRKGMRVLLQKGERICEGKQKVWGMGSQELLFRKSTEGVFCVTNNSTKAADGRFFAIISHSGLPL